MILPTNFHTFYCYRLAIKEKKMKSVYAYCLSTLLLHAATGLKWLLITVSRSWKHIIRALSDPDENKCVAFVLASRQHARARSGDHG